MAKRSASFVVDTTGDENLRPKKRVSSSQHGPRSSQSSQPRASQSFRSSQGYQLTSTQVERDAWQENNEEYDVIDLSQDVDEGFGWVCLGAINDKV
jgi:SWI/SNF-related matrix-associated actin-dependent regulator of chromatin subfamily A3